MKKTDRWRSRDEARTWVKTLQKELVRPAVILLSGDLGAGKTQLVKWFLDDLGVDGVMSPTFAIHQQYDSPKGAVDHVDLYRVPSAQDLESSGFWDLFRAEHGLVFVEWADRLSSDAWPRDWRRIFIHLEKDASGSEARTVRWEIKRP